MAFWELANALFAPVARFFLEVEVPGLGISVFFLCVGIILINVVINVILIMLGVSSAYDDPVTAVAYDNLHTENGPSPFINLGNERPGRSRSDLMYKYAKASIKAYRFKRSRKKK